jgi:hypothetical protein
MAVLRAGFFLDTASWFRLERSDNQRLERSEEETKRERCEEEIWGGGFGGDGIM